MNRFKKFLRLLGVMSLIALSASTGLAYAETDSTGLNNTTGPYSRNITDLDIDRFWDVQVENLQRLFSDYDVDVDAGHNDTERNTVVGDQATGNVNVDITGDNGTYMSSFFGWDTLASVLPEDLAINVDFSGANNITGPFSDNINDADIDQRIDIDLENRTFIDNDLDFDASTGHNDTYANTLVGDVTTGDINLDANLSSYVPSESDLAVSGLSLGGDNIVTSRLGNSLTGPNSENENYLDIYSDIDVDVENDLRVSNNYDIWADTGGNDVSYNTSVGNVTTGDINVSINGTF